MRIRGRLLGWAAILTAGALAPTAAMAQAVKPTPAQDCSSVCTTVDGAARMVQQCRRHVAPDEVNTLPAFKPLPPPPPGQKCAIYSPIQLFNPTSPNCWISDKKFCVYRKPGKTGYACTCGRISGYFD